MRFTNLTNTNKGAFEPMDKLQELEEKKRQLKELRERRRNHGGLVNYLLQSAQTSNNAMISTSVQTDAVESTEYQFTPNNLSEPPKEVVTYEKAIQVDLSETLRELTSTPTTQVPTPLEKPLEAIEESRIQPEASPPHVLTELEPLLVEGQQNSIHNKSFSILEVLKKSNCASFVTGKKEGFQFEHAATWDSKLFPHEHSQLICVSLDYHDELMVAVFQSLPLQKFATTAITWSHVNVFRWGTNQVVDSIEFRGQTVLGARFLRRRAKSNVISILLTTYTGKTILHELKCMGSDQYKRMERNLIVKNYHAHPIYAFDEFDDVPLGKERFLVASTNGVINELSSLDLSVYRDATSNTQSISQVMVEPPRASEICELGQSDDENEKDAKDDTKQQCFTDHLLKVALSGELAITSLAISRSNQDMLYLGTEDGGIYRVLLTEMDHHKIKVSKVNHGFLPCESPPAFHSSHVVALTYNTQDLLLSASLDWTCCLWDPKNNCKLSSIDVGTPIIAIQWVQENTSIILTCNTLLVVTWPIIHYTDRHTRLQRFQCTAPPHIQSRLSTEDTQSGFFTCFKAFPSGDSNIVAIGSNTNTVLFYHIPDIPKEDIAVSG